MIFTRNIDSLLAKLLKPANLKKLNVTSKSFPSFRFPDFHRAIEVFLSTRETLAKIPSFHAHVSLSQICNRQLGDYGQLRKVQPGSTELVPVSYRKEEAFPSECFWVYRDDKNDDAGIVRIRSAVHTHFTEVEVASSNSDMGTKILEELCDLSVKHSVYRNKLLEVDFTAEIHDEFGQSRPNELQVSFRPDPKVTAEDIVIDPEIEPILERNVVRFHQMRDRLKDLGLPLQRGVLLHGPPGTGKTYTCQYLYHRLKPVTMIVVAGKGLTQVKSICNLARMLHPAVVVLEDVDLIFTSREVNLYSTGLGEMMDELDGFSRDDAVTFIFTTNAIDRLEQAIKDRPGRISQCIYMGLPNAELRRRYLVRFLRDYNVADVDLDRVVELAEGGSQAFLQEVVNRAVQISAETEADVTAKIKLTTVHFEEAIAEMTKFTQKSTESIIGFQGRVRV
jgi:cell division protease FtsH